MQTIGTSMSSSDPESKQMRHTVCSPMGRECRLKLESNLRTIIHGKAFQFGIVALAGLEGILLVAMLMLEIEKLQSK
uniref:CNNM transmembrane domain-containing protein n=1 Tax=Mesocestoides corti TaxID=53468 RepID=A0A5K3FSG3_MESCO